MKNFGRLAALLAGGTFALAAAPAALAQTTGSNPNGAYPAMRSGAVFGRPLPANGASQGAQPHGGQFAPMRPGPVFNGRPLPTGNSGPVVVLPEAPPRYSNNGYSNNGYANGRGAFTQIRSGWNGSPITNVNNYGNNYGNPNLPPIGPGNGFFSGSIPPIGPANGFFNNLTPPVGPGNGFFNNNAPTGTQDNEGHHRHREYPIYGATLNTDGLVAGAPLLGGYYYGNYCDTGDAIDTYPSVYSVYAGFPQYILSPGVTVSSVPDLPVYVTPYQSFDPPTYSVTYNNNYYYVANEDRANDLEAGGDRATEALQNAYPANSFQAAFGDIARAWTDSDIKPLRKHVRDSETRISVLLNRKYSYSIASGDFVQITRDALDRLHTVSFEFTHIRKAKNGDVTAYGKHVYRAGAASADSAGDGAIVPFDQAGSDTGTASNDQSSAPTDGTEKTVYVSYTLHHGDTQWYIIAVDSSEKSLVPDDK